MKLNLIMCAVLSMTVSASSLNAADGPLKLNVWPNAVPGEIGAIGKEQVAPPRGKKKVIRLMNVTKPTLTVFKPAKKIDTGAAIVVCPGGGYNILAYDLEGTEVCDWLNSIGVTGILLKYRVPRRKNLPKHQAPLQDAQRAMSLSRHHAKAWGIDPQRIGILGFSAGGHLSASASTNFDIRHYEPVDDIDKVNCRPDFAVLIYPAYLMEGKGLAPEIRVSNKTPPTFFAHAGDDGISAENSIQMYLALKKAKVPAELHVYSSGGHGFGLRPSKHPSSTWPKRCEEWMRQQGILKQEKD